LLLGGPAPPARAAVVPAGVGAAGAAEVIELPPSASYRLSDRLAAALGVPTLDQAGPGGLGPPASAPAGGRTPPVGSISYWPALDASHGGALGIYLKQYTLRAVGEKIEVWVASGCDAVSCGTELPKADCRNRVVGSARVTDGQVRELVHQFDANMYPRQTAAFSAPPDRDGSGAPLGLRAAGLDFTGNGSRTVTLVDMIRQPNFYDFPNNPTYIAGFYSPAFNLITDRNVMTIDAYDWAHRTGANPPDDADPADVCTSRPAHPYLYEAVFAHEWQHLLEHYRNPKQATWLNEGLSMFAESLDGYTDTRRRIDQPGAQLQLLCFQGWGTVRGPANPNPRPCGGPATSLTLWGDQGTDSGVPANYGGAWSFLLYCRDRFGPGFVTGLHRDGEHSGLAAVQAQLERVAPGLRVPTLLHQFQLMNLLDRAARHSRVSGIDRSLVTARDLDAELNLANPAAIGSGGAAPNGADYVRLGPGRALRAMRFVGSPTVDAAPGSAADPAAQLAGLLPYSAPVSGWNVALVGIDARRHRVLVDSRPGFGWSADRGRLAAFADYPEVIAVISHDDPADTAVFGERHAHYALSVDASTGAIVHRN